MKLDDQNPEEPPSYPLFTREWWGQAADDIDAIAPCYGGGVCTRALQKLAAGTRKLAARARPAGVS